MVDGVHHEVEAVHTVVHRHVEERGNGALFLVAADNKAYATSFSVAAIILLFMFENLSSQFLYFKFDAESSLFSHNKILSACLMPGILLNSLT